MLKDNKKSLPLISIIMNCFNGEDFLKEALDSILDQDYKNWELIFWDNKSTDKSLNIYNSYNDKRFKYFLADTHTTLTEARNKAIPKANGEIIAFLDVDDYWSSNKLSKQIELFKDDNVGLVYSNYWVLNDQSIFSKKNIFSKKKLPEGNVLEPMLRNYSVGTSAMMIRKKYIKNINHVFKEEYDLLADFDFVINFAIKYKFGCIQEPLVFYRINTGKNISITQIDKQIPQLRFWYSETKKNPILSQKKELKKVLERINYMESVRIILKKSLLQGFCQVFKFPFVFKKLKLILGIIIKRYVFFKAKELN